MSAVRVLPCVLWFAFASGCDDPECSDGECPPAEVVEEEPDAAVPEDEPLMCSNTTCRETETELLILEACCDDQVKDVCGVFVGETLGPLEGCLAKHRPGTPSESCGELLDQLDKPLDTLDPGDDGAFTFKLGDEVVALPACCVSTGECGVRYDKFEVLGSKVAVGAGCVPVGRLDLAEYGDSVPVTASHTCVP